MKIEPVSVILENIKAAMKDRKATYRSVGDEAGIDPGHLSKILSGKLALEMNKFRRICMALGVRPARIMPDDWLDRTDSGAMEHIIETVIGAYLQLREQSGIAFANEKQLTEVIMLLAAEGCTKDLTPREAIISLKSRFSDKKQVIN